MFIWTPSILCTNKMYVLKCQWKYLSPHQLHKFFDRSHSFRYYHPLYYHYIISRSFFKNLTGWKAREIFSRFSRLKASDNILSHSLFYFPICIKFLPSFNSTLYFLRAQKKLSKYHFIYHKSHLNFPMTVF